MRDQTGDAGSTHDGDWASPAEIGQVISHPYVIEILDVLTEGPMVLGCIQSRVRAGRRAIAAALRVAAANGLVAGAGSWDVITPDRRLYQLTTRGLALVQKLSSLAVWAAVIDVEDPHADPVSGS
jgi:DNA-binding HxlR family transcriptional regulator